MTPTTLPAPPYRITTRRLTLRCWNPRDAPMMMINATEFGAFDAMGRKIMS